MTLPDRLRSHAQNNEMGPSGGYTEAGHLLNEAAAAIEMQKRVVADAQADVEKLDAEVERLREGLASLDCTCIGPVPTGDDPALYRCTRCAALRAEE